MQPNFPSNPLPLLHIDDSSDDRALVAQAIFLTDTPFTFHEATGLESAIPFFQSSAEIEHPEAPALILLDYNLGDHTGVEFLYWLRLMKKIRSVPVVMFSNSTSPREIAECYSNGANYFINKPTDLARLKLIVRSLHESLVPYERPGLLRLLTEYQPDPAQQAGSPLKLRSFPATKTGYP